MNWRAAIPNGLTLCNLACGVLAILVMTVAGGLDRILAAASFVALAALFDLLDGAVARALRVSSPLGVQLDSLADVVSFGVAPCIFLMVAVASRLGLGLALLSPASWPLFLLLTSPALAAAYRLARFNVAVPTNKLTHFEGLPSPAAGLLLSASCVCLVLQEPKMQYGEDMLGAIVGVGLLSALAMVSRWPFLSFKGPTLHKLAVVAVFATGALVAWLSGWQPWVVLVTLVLYAVVSRALIRPTPATPHAAQ